MLEPRVCAVSTVLSLIVLAGGRTTVLYMYIRTSVHADNYARVMVRYVHMNKLHNFIAAMHRTHPHRTPAPGLPWLYSYKICRVSHVISADFELY